jgi:hypothetical protein
MRYLYWAAIVLFLTGLALSFTNSSHHLMQAALGAGLVCQFFYRK